MQFTVEIRPNEHVTEEDLISFLRRRGVSRRVAELVEEAVPGIVTFVTVRRGA